ncbi:MAG: hypothetical protein ACOYL8_00360 [Patescibacteria group bacterium]
MKNPIILKLGAPNPVAPSNQAAATPGAQATQPAASKWTKITSNDFFRIFVAGSVAFGIYFGTIFLLPDAACWIKHSVALFLSLIALLFFGSAMKKGGTLGDSIVVGLFLIFFFSIAREYLGTGVTAPKPPVESTENGVSSETYDSSGNLILGEGNKEFKLKSGESTPWFGFKNGVVADYSFSPSSTNYKIIVSDGTEYSGTLDGSLPLKRHCFYRIVAGSDMSVTLKVDYR